MSGDTKRCFACGETKPLDGFHRTKGRADGRKADCKPCATARTRQWRQANPERYSEYQREYYDRGRDRKDGEK